ncbi:hypothetical protein [Commensalibacter oyaizuii]|uniref:Uncharacterized protein n=1 Tax=Commensalibacter oyaizuii TaxID=3043873 RepID=A0ABT6PZT1_9PROT|nr:hypothetical protein [Commensalibacter sp. TBRC 16381]MDI2090358.1 hypothetical protein [Commensalibacter sp. TBRC 16381]
MLLSPRDDDIALDFTTNKNGLGYVIDFKFIYYYGRNLTYEGDMLVSEESLQKFTQEIEFLL